MKIKRTHFKHRPYRELKKASGNRAVPTRSPSLHCEEAGENKDHTCRSSKSALMKKIQKSTHTTRKYKQWALYRFPNHPFVQKVAGRFDTPRWRGRKNRKTRNLVQGHQVLPGQRLAQASGARNDAANRPTKGGVENSNHATLGGHDQSEGISNCVFGDRLGKKTAKIFFFMPPVETPCEVTGLRSSQK